jgi:hypothetical protein
MRLKKKSEDVGIEKKERYRGELTKSMFWRSVE